MREIAGFLEKNKTIEKVLVVCFNEEAFKSYSNALEEVLGSE